MKTERIIITFNPDGSFRGASATDFGGLPVDLDPARLADVAPMINAAALASLAAKDAEIAEITKAKDAEIAQLIDFKSRAEAGIAQVVAVIQDPTIDAETTAQTVLAVIAEGTAPEAERERAKIRQQIAELQAKLGE